MKRRPLTRCLLVLAAAGIVHEVANGASLEQELSSRGLALATITIQPEPQLIIRLFDGRFETRHLECCRDSLAGIWISRDRLIAMKPAAFQGRSDMGLHIVVANLDGVVVSESEVTVFPAGAAFSLSPDGERAALIGSVVGSSGTLEQPGIYVIGMNGTPVRRLVDIRLSEPNLNEPGPSVDWAPDGRRIVFSYGRDINVVDSEGGPPVRLAAGYGARWSPRDNQIAFMSVAGEAKLVDVASGAARPIRSGAILLQPPLWSPDGDYLLFVERHHSIAPCVSYATSVVVRVSDGATQAINCFGIVGQRAQWIRLPRAGSTKPANKEK